MNLSIDRCPRFARFLLGLCFAGALFAAEPARQKFDVPAGEASATLRQFAAQSGQTVVYFVETVRGVRTGPVRGEFTAREALNRMLAGTELVLVQDEKSGALTISRVSDPNVARAAQAKKSDRPEIDVVAAQRVQQGEDPVVLDDYQVTGSRIRMSPREENARPLVSYTRRDLERFGISSLGDVTRLIPQIGSSNKISSAGLSGRDVDALNNLTSASDARVSVNLRGLPRGSTLVLVNGKRISRSGQDTGADDYGLEGIPLSAIERIDVLTSGAGAVYGSDAVGGVVNVILRRNYSGSEAKLTYDNTFKGDAAVLTASLSTGFSRDKFNLFGSVSYEKRNALAAVDRWFTATDDKRSIGGTDQRFLPGGAGRLFVLSFDPVMIVGDLGIPAGSDGSNNVTLAQYLAAPIPDNVDAAPYFNLIDPQRNKSAALRTEYNFAPHFNLYFDGNWSQTKTISRGLPQAFTGSTAVQLPAGTPGTAAFGNALLIQVNKTLWDTPNPVSFLSESSLATLGARGDLFGDWRYDTTAHWSRSQLNNSRWGLDPAKVAAAHGAGTLNVLADQSATPIPFSLVPTLSNSGPTKEISDTYTYNAEANGTVWTVPTGDIKAAAGVEYTRQETKFDASAIDTLSTAAQLAPMERSIRSAFAEVTIPLAPIARRWPLLHRLEVGLQGRNDDYSDFGAKFSPGVSLVYGPTDWISLRASRSEGYKVPSLFDIHGPRLNMGAVFITPAQGLVDPVTGLPLAGIFTTYRQGNPVLQPEESVSENWGAVVTVPFIKGLSLTADHYDIDYRNMAGAPPSFQYVLDFLPDRIERDPNTGAVKALNFSALNIASLRTRGWDYRLNYERRFSFGDVSLQAQYTHVQYTGQQPVAGSPIVVTDAPDRATASLFWSAGPWGAGATVHYQSRYYRDAARTREAASELGYDSQLTYDFGRDPGFRQAHGWRRALSDMKVSITVINAIYNDVGVDEAINGTWVVDPRLQRYVISLTRKF